MKLPSLLEEEDVPANKVVQKPPEPHVKITISTGENTNKAPHRTPSSQSAIGPKDGVPENVTEDGVPEDLPKDVVAEDGVPEDLPKDVVAEDAARDVGTEDAAEDVGTEDAARDIGTEYLPKNLPRILDPETIPRKPYRRRSDSEKDVKHWGQRKLCLSEIEFLTDYLPLKSEGEGEGEGKEEGEGEGEGEGRTTVVYAGAAPGTHITILVDLFPQVDHWILIDPARFGLADHPRVEKRRECFTDKLAAEIRSRLFLESEFPYILFISDIRTANWKLMSRKANEDQIATDNNDQMRWCQILKPDRAMLKFRLPYGAGSTFYLPGEIRFQVWAPPSSTETRLIPHCYDKMVPYKHLDYEQRLFFFNTEIRMNHRFPHSVKGPGLNNRYDSAAEVLILARYLARFSQDLGNPTLNNKEITKLSKRLSQLIGQSDEGLAGRLPESARRVRM